MALLRDIKSTRYIRIHEVPFLRAPGRVLTLQGHEKGQRIVHSTCMTYVPPKIFIVL